MYSGTWLAEQTGVKAPVERDGGQRENLRRRPREEGGGDCIKERSRTGKSEEDNLLVGPLLGGIVVNGDTARGDGTSLLRPGDVTVGSLLGGGTQLEGLAQLLTRTPRRRGRRHRT